MSNTNKEWDFENKNGYQTSCEKIKSVSDFASCIKSIWNNKWQKGRDNLQKKYPQYAEEEPPWFRGVCDNTYSLMPGLYWQFKNENEEQVIMMAEDIREEFKRRGVFIEQHNRFLEDGEWLQLMQHYGVPTRLLDWTEGALIALYFSIRMIVYKKKNKKTTPCVWMLNPSWLNDVTNNTSLPAYLNESAMAKYPNTDAKARPYLIEKELPDYPIAIYPMYIDPKMIAQKSTFTLHGKIKDSFMELSSKYSRDAQICNILIDLKKTNAIAEELTMMGITESTIFPDLKSIANEIRNEKGIDFSFDR